VKVTTFISIFGGRSGTGTERQRDREKKPNFVDGTLLGTKSHNYKYAKEKKRTRNQISMSLSSYKLTD